MTKPGDSKTVRLDAERVDRVAAMTRIMQGSAFGTTLGLLWQCLAFKEFHGPGVIHTEVALP